MLVIKKDVLVLENKKEIVSTKSSNKLQDNDRMPKKLFLQDFNIVGEKHNQGLDFVLNRIVEARNAGKQLEHVRSIEFIMNSTMDFISQDSKLKDQVDILKDKKQDVIKGIRVLFEKSPREYISKHSSFTEKQKKYALALLSLSKENYTQWVASVNTLIRDVQNSDLSVGEQYPLFVMASVALKSAEYWIAKEDLWSKVLLRGNDSNKPQLEREYIITPIEWNWGKFVDSMQVVLP